MMTRLELLLAAGLLIFVCALSSAGPGFGDLAASEVSAEPSLITSLIPLQRCSFQVAAIAVTLLGLLLEDGRRRAANDPGESRPASSARRP